MTRHALAIIPARGSSRGIPGKNLALAGGRPLLSWTTDAALRASAVSRTIVSTDDEEIKQVAIDLGVEVPFLRPPELARGDTPMAAVVCHAINWLRTQEASVHDYSYVIALQPTSPLRLASDIDAAAALAFKRNADAVVSVSPSVHHPFWTKRVLPDGTLDSFIAEIDEPTRRQDLPPAYCLNGAIYMARPEIWCAVNSLGATRAHAYVMPAERSLDVDELWDLHLADVILRARVLS